MIGMYAQRVNPASHCNLQDTSVVTPKNSEEAEDMSLIKPPV